MKTCILIAVIFSCVASKIVIMDLKYTFVEELAHININLSRTKDDIFTISSRTIQKVDFNKMLCNIAISFPSNKQSSNFNMVLINNTINLCRIAKGYMGNHFVQTVVNIFLNHSNFLLTCPLPKGNYTYLDFPVSNKYIPQMIPGGKFKLSLSMKALVPKAKAFKEVYAILAIGEYLKQ